jgi:hypothetical protein
MKDWVKITISVRKSTAKRVLRVKNEYGLSYDELFNEYVRLKSMIKPLFKPKNSIFDKEAIKYLKSR